MTLRHLMVAGLLLCCGIPVEARPKPGARTVPVLAGFWETPAGRLQVKVEAGGAVVGTLDSVRPGIPLERGMVMLRGSFVDDNLSGEARLGLVATPCGAVDKQAFVMLLLTKSGKLTGSFGTKEGCAVGVRSVLFTRSPDQTASIAAPPPPIASPPVPPDAELFLMPDWGGEAPSAPVAAAAEPAAPAPTPQTTADRAPLPKEAAKRVRGPIERLLEEGLELAQSGQYEAARERFTKAAEQQPNRGEAYNGVGMTYAMRNDYELALEWYKRGLENAPGFPDLYFNMACAYAQQGKKALALRYLKLSASKGFAQPEMLEDPDLAGLKSEPEWAAILKLMASPAGTGTP